MLESQDECRSDGRVNQENHKVQTQSRIATIIMQAVIEQLGGDHQLGQVQTKVELYNTMHAKFRNEGLLADAEPYLKTLRGSFLQDA